MAVTVSSSAATTGNLSTGFAVSTVVATGDIILATWHSSTGTSLTSVTYNSSESLSLVASTPVTNTFTTEIWEITNPTVTTADVVFNHSGGMHHSSGKTISLLGAGTPSDGANNNPSTSPSTIVVSNFATDDLTLDAIAMTNNPAEGTNQTGFGAGSSGGSFFEASHNVTNGTMTWTFTNTAGAHSACRIPAAAAGFGALLAGSRNFLVRE